MLISEQNKKEIFYNLINSGLAGSLVFLGSLTNGLTWSGVCFGTIAALVVAITKFKAYWASEKSEYSKTTFFNFL